MTNHVFISLSAVQIYNISYFHLYRCVQVKISSFFFEFNLNGQNLNQPSNKRVYPNCPLPLWNNEKVCGSNMYWGWWHGFILFVFCSMVLLFCSSILLDIIVYVIFIISKFCAIPNSHACIMRASVKLPLCDLLTKIDQN